MPKRRARNHSAADVLAGVDANWPFPRFRLTDEQWSEVARLSEIPEGEDDARHHIETTIGMFRQFEASDLDRMTPARIREELEALAVLAEDLNSRLNKLVQEQDAYNAMTGTASLYSPLDRLTDFAGPHQSEHLPSSVQSMTGPDGQQRLLQVLDAVLRLPKWLLVAAHRVGSHRIRRHAGLPLPGKPRKADKPGPKAGSVYWLVGNLDGIREQFTGKKITRSYKDAASKKYITYVCRIADPDIGDGTVDMAMKDRIKKRERLKSPAVE
jgi:hypothetical protein